ncbi:extracellular solute-binding protein [Cohnella ginsengisoli]|uniref:Extracellular solute-binding protein n=1 Tax=Cohnella ginsengisoli TaxID=425004 RepID=A0A9X4KHU6_9BACL|nr:extracellular solute-binding protein [Cohnella ginsengisoli]MDG0792447.1 extracellular solute-binding protein [Cohnella ginsengisoli]
MLVQNKLGKSALALAALSVVLAGCGGNNNNKGADASPSSSASASPSASANASASPSASASESASPSASASDLKEYKLTLYLPGTPPKDEAKVEAEINKYLKEKINATLDLNLVDWGQWDNKMNLAIASRDPMDVIFTAAWNGHATNVAKGAFLPLNDPNGKYGNLLEQYGQDILSSLPEAFLKGAKINGFNYAVPTDKELAEQGGIVYRKDIADELGLTDKLKAVKTIADLDPILAEVKAKKPQMIPLFLRDGDNFNAHYFAKYDYLGDATIEGVILKNAPDTTVMPRFELPRYKETLTVTRDFFKKGLHQQGRSHDAAKRQRRAEEGQRVHDHFGAQARQGRRDGERDRPRRQAGTAGDDGSHRRHERYGRLDARNLYDVRRSRPRDDVHQPAA